MSWWRHQMETFSALLAICAGNSPVPGEFHAQRPVTRSFDIFFDLRIKGWVNNREAGDLKRYLAHYDVTVMSFLEESQSHGCPTGSKVTLKDIGEINRYLPTTVHDLARTAFTNFRTYHDDLLHENISRVTEPFLRGIHRSPVDSPHKGPVARSFYFHFYTCIYIYFNGWRHIGVGGDLRRHNAHVTSLQCEKTYTKRALERVSVWLYAALPETLSALHKPYSHFPRAAILSYRTCTRLLPPKVS